VWIALTIAGSDPTGGAGLQLDLRVFQRFGVHGAAVPTALTVQDTAKVHQVLPVFPNVVLEQIRVLVRDFVPHAVKLGMLATDDVVISVERGLDELRRRAGQPVPVVVDPVLAASDGTPLLERRAQGSLARVIADAALVTPNLLEASELTGLDTSTAAGAEAAAKALLSEFGAAAALVKGGHREGPPDDLLATRSPSGPCLRWLAGRRREVGPVHGTGCALSAAIAAGLARGDALEAAIEAARAFVARAIGGAVAAGRGARLLDVSGP
jgi:hydroxymethylpyrimidine/phosphomethylpyrimidine kinase